MGPYLPIQNYLDIGTNSVAAYNLSTCGASPSRFTGGGARGWVPIKGARISTFEIHKILQKRI